MFVDVNVELIAVEQTLPMLVEYNYQLQHLWCAAFGSFCGTDTGS